MSSQGKALPLTILQEHIDEFTAGKDPTTQSHDWYRRDFLLNNLDLVQGGWMRQGGGENVESLDRGAEELNMRLSSRQNAGEER